MNFPQSQFQPSHHCFWGVSTNACRPCFHTSSKQTPYLHFSRNPKSSDFQRTIKLNNQSDTVFDMFHDNVPLSIYEHYLPIVLYLFERPCRMCSIENLMSPGFSESIAHSAGTSSGAIKDFPMYNHPKHMSTGTSQTMKASSATSQSGGKSCIVYLLQYRQVVEAVDDEGDIKLKMLVCLMSTECLTRWCIFGVVPRS